MVGEDEANYCTSPALWVLIFWAFNERFFIRDVFLLQYLDYQKATDLSRENFTFSCRVILGDYLQPMPPEYATEGEYVRLTEDDVNKR